VWTLSAPCTRKHRVTYLLEQHQLDLASTSLSERFPYPLLLGDHHPSRAYAMILADMEENWATGIWHPDSVTRCSCVAPTSSQHWPAHRLRTPSRTGT